MTRIVPSDWKNRDVQALCALGQGLLMQTDYRAADVVLTYAEARAWSDRDWDGLSRLYMPLQESRRQRRQLCGEGVVRLDLIDRGDGCVPSAEAILEAYPHGQLLVAGRCTLAPAIELRDRVARGERLRLNGAGPKGLGRESARGEGYIETFLAASYHVEGAWWIVIAPHAESRVPESDPSSVQRLRESVGEGAIVVHADRLPAMSARGDAETFALTMAWWEQLASPFLKKGLALADGIEKIAQLREAIRVDSACELAHQTISRTARAMMRRSA
jgi:hypothetical protein